MLVNASKLLDYPILSIHVGGEIGRTEEAIVDPATLKIAGFYVWSKDANGDILETKDIREFANVGMIVDSADAFECAEDAMKMAKLVELNFNLKGMKIETKKGTKLGTVKDFMVETGTFSVVQLVVKRPVLKALIDPELIIPRKEIVEVTDYKVIVKDEEEKIRTKAAREDFVPNFVNPFREPDFSSQKVAREKRDE